MAAKPEPVVVDDAPETVPTGPLVVQPRDTWASVADRAHVDPADLLAANGGQHRPLVVGEELYRP